MSDDEIENKPKQSGPWQKGRSGNPGGRPAGYSEFRELCRTKMPEAVATLTTALSDDKLCVAAAKVLLEYGFGKAPSAPDDLDAVREGGAALDLSRRQLVAIARGEKPDDE